MKVNCILKSSQRLFSEAIVLPYFQTPKGRAKACFDEKTFLKWGEPAIKLKDFKGEQGEVFVVYPKTTKEQRVLLLGLGENQSLTIESLRRAYAKVIQFCHQQSIKKLSFVMPQITKLSDEDLLQGVLEGLFLTNYVFENLKGKSASKTTLVQKATLLGVDPKRKKEVQKWQDLSEGVCLARDLVNGNADEVNAKKLGEVAQKLSKDFPKIKTTILDKKKLEEEKLKLILAVNRSTKVDPSLIIMQYQGNPQAKGSTAIIGKGITYDTGGIQLKPRAGSIIDMKCDMSGAAAVLGILYAAAKLDLPLNIVGVIPACENSIGPESYKPGDVYESYLGKTVEIISTDAEGRLALADAIAYTQDHFQTDHLIDLATLTGGVVAALGNSLTGMMSNHPKMSEKMLIASEKSGEKVWELPLYEDYKSGLKSQIADIKNAPRASGYPSAIIAGLFLKEFVKTTSWAHLDIAGTAYLDQPKHYHKSKATGVGVRLVIAFLEELLES